MGAKLACIVGQEFHRRWDTGRIDGEKLGPRETPFGASGDIFVVECGNVSYHVLCRHGLALKKTAPHKVNYRANMYALKDLGIDCVLAWGPAGAITHNVAVGDLVIVDDVIDQTHLRAETFFEDSPLGFLREVPVFCPSLQSIVAGVLHGMKLVYHASGTMAVREGPRLETPAEVRMLAAVGAEIVTHTFVPEMFLAKELQMCYAAVAYVVNYAETGSRHKPFAAGQLFGGLTQKTDGDRLEGAVSAMNRIVSQVAESLSPTMCQCDCLKTMAPFIKEYQLSDDWRKWFI